MGQVLYHFCCLNHLSITSSMSKRSYFHRCYFSIINQINDFSFVFPKVFELTRPNSPHTPALLLPYLISHITLIFHLIHSTFFFVKLRCILNCTNTILLLNTSEIIKGNMRWGTYLGAKGRILKFE